MSTPWVPLLFGVVGLDLCAVALLVLAARERRAAAAVPTVTAQPAAEPPRLRGEIRLVEDLTRWAERHPGGEILPEAAGSDRRPEHRVPIYVRADHNGTATSWHAN